VTSSVTVIEAAIRVKYVQIQNINHKDEREDGMKEILYTNDYIKDGTGLTW